jgi:hypothetical protein
MSILRQAAAPALVLAVALLPGCKPKPPEIVPVEGTVYLDGQPVPLARVDFVPDLADFGAEYMSSAVTDEKGHFVLMTTAGAPGAAVAKHKVVVAEYTPEELRGFSPAAQDRLAAYQAKLKNRPIPEQYGIAVKTPLTVEVKPGQTTYDLQLKR